MWLNKLLGFSEPQFLYLCNKCTHSCPHLLLQKVRWLKWDKAAVGKLTPQGLNDPLTVSVNTVYWMQPHPCLYILSIAAFLQQEQNRVIASETSWAFKQKTNIISNLLSGPFWKEYANPCSQGFYKTKQFLLAAGFPSVPLLSHLESSWREFF